MHEQHPPGSGDDVRCCAQVIFHVTIHQKRLELPDDCPAGFKALCEDCMSQDCEQRPKFTQVLTLESPLMCAQCSVRLHAALPCLSLAGRCVQGCLHWLHVSGLRAAAQVHTGPPQRLPACSSAIY